MPCYRCGARQADPDRGASPWKRGVAGGEQVLVCPDCQSVHDWTADLDRCAACGSTVLVRALGETRCRGCGAVDQVVAGSGSSLASPAGTLPDEVAEALDRLLRPDGA